MDLSNYKLPEVKKERTSERAEAIRPFVGRVKLYEEVLTAERLGVLLSVYKETRDLYDLYKKCDQADNFNKMFWWHFKKK